MDLGEALQFFTTELADHTEDPALEARLLIQKATGLSRPVLLSRPEFPLDNITYTKISALCKQRQQGIPLPYLLGEWEFYGHPFFVDPSVLIPRPETELLVEQAAAWLKNYPQFRDGFDIGTGSGCIAISLLLAFPELRMTAVELKPEALRTAIRNAERHRCSDRFRPVCADLFSAISCEPRLICANLPYIPSETCRTIEPARFEPMSALDGGADGFDLYRLLFAQIANKIKGECLILCEIEYRQRELALATARAFFPGRTIRVLNDLAGMARVLEIRG
ncbi:MAG: peptide chain release factor N(5)-glutamine methyltransferase [Flexilinea sp.]|nr:peptide chain release factor N(5)-glutamine methyltransferase [Flexilinea sp.]